MEVLVVKTSLQGQGAAKTYQNENDKLMLQPK